MKNGLTVVEGGCAVKKPLSRKEPAMKSIVLDVHAASFTMPLLTEKDRLARVRSNNTTAHDLMEVVRTVVKPKALLT
jgi:hypothetical protein